MTLFVIGAGATRGCSFVNSSDNPCLPPLDGDYFSQLQKITNQKHIELVQSVMQDVIKVFGLNFNVSMETVFTTFEHMSKMIDATGKESNFTGDELENMRERLRQSIQAVLEESLVKHDTKAGSSIKPSQCEFHDKLVKILKPKDAVISFNYDCVLDYALKNHGDNKWNPRYGYGFDLGAKGSKLKGDKYWSPETPASKEDTIKYFKLHGSLNFDIKNVKEAKSSVVLKQRPYTRQNGIPQFTIIPPEWNKSFGEGVFGDLWRKAALEITRHKEIIVIGYSMPPTDLHSSALFRTSLKSKNLKSLVVANPDKNARRRIREVFYTGLDSRTKVISCDSLREFISLERIIWS